MEGALGAPGRKPARWRGVDTVAQKTHTDVAQLPTKRDILYSRVHDYGHGKSQSADVALARPIIYPDRTGAVPFSRNVELLAGVGLSLRGSGIEYPSHTLYN